VSDIPKSALLNISVRKQILQLGYTDPEFARAWWFECARDPVLFICTMCWILEPRKTASWKQVRKYGESKVIPFITRDYQDELIERSAPVLGTEDLIVWKSREMGITLVYLALALWDTIFHEHTQVGFVSKDLLTADNEEDPNSLMSMFRFILDRLPRWLKPTYVRNQAKHSFVFENKSTITAYAATGDFVRGGRKAWLLLDEFHFFGAQDDYAALDASVDASNGRVIVSTVNRFKGESGAFYSIVNDPNHSGHLIELDWWQDKEKAVGLYHSDRIGTTEKFRLVIDDHEFWDRHQIDCAYYRDPDDTDKTYNFILDGQKRSLYYDWRCRRPNATKESVAAELGRQFGSSLCQLCDAESIARAVLLCKKPTRTAEIYRNPEKPDQWICDFAMDGNTTFWCDLKDDKPPPGDYSIGADISAGTGGSRSSYSCLQVFNRLTGDHVCEWRSNRVDVLAFTELSVWLCRFFHNAFLVPEMNGNLGSSFIKRLIELKYGNIFRRKVETKSYVVTTEFIGYVNKDGGRHLLSALDEAIRCGKAHVNSVLALREMLRYIVKEDKVVHTSSVNDDDAGGKGRAHGDAAIALGVAWLGVVDHPVREVKEENKPVPENCFLARRQEFLENQRRKTTTGYWQPRYR
jgi:hypothetical protein